MKKLAFITLFPTLIFSAGTALAGSSQNFDYLSCLKIETSMDQSNVCHLSIDHTVGDPNKCNTRLRVRGTLRSININENNVSWSVDKLLNRGDKLRIHASGGIAWCNFIGASATPE